MGSITRRRARSPRGRSVLPGAVAVLVLASALGGWLAVTLVGELRLLATGPADAVALEEGVRAAVTAAGLGLCGWYLVSALALIVAALPGGARAGAGAVERLLVTAAAPGMRRLVARGLCGSAGATLAMGAALGPAAAQPPAEEDLGWRVTAAPVLEPSSQADDEEGRTPVDLGWGSAGLEEEGVPEPAPEVPEHGAAVEPDEAGPPLQPDDPASTAGADTDETDPDRPDQASASAQEPPPAGASEHTVRRGESLWSITAESLRQGGEEPATPDLAAAWPRVYEANREVIGADPDLILPGQVLAIPDLAEIQEAS